MPLLGTMYTFTTYGTWLRGDERGWIDDGKLMPPDPVIEEADFKRLKHDVFLFEATDLLRIGDMIGRSVISRLGLRVFALTVQVWHVHLVVGASENGPPAIAKCAKEAVRYGLRVGRPIWTADYDKRFCFDELSLSRRIAYVQRHNTAMGWPANPWDFIADID